MMLLSELEHELVDVFQQSRYLVAAVMLGTLWFAESVVPLHFRRHRLAHGAANLGIAIVNGVLKYWAAFAILYVTEFSRAAGFGLLYRFALPVWVHWLLAILVFDCWQYWWHRINHVVPLFWRFHAVHHSDAEMDATSGVRFHTCEILLSVAARLVVLPLIGMTVPQLLLYESMSLPIILFHHGNIRLPNQIDVALRWLIVTPWMHWVHHSRWKPETNSNYSSFLSVWDRIFGSFRLRERPQDIDLGLDGWEEHQWRRLSGMFAAPFQANLYSQEPRIDDDKHKSNDGV